MESKLKFTFENKFISFLGDSITTFQGALPDGNRVFYADERGFTYKSGIFSVSDTWWGQVLSRLGATLLVNQSWSGSRVSMSDQNEECPAACTPLRYAHLHKGETTPDHILIYMGTNDRWEIPPTSEEDKTSLTIFENAYRHMLCSLHLCYPQADVWCITLGNSMCSREPSSSGIHDHLNIPFNLAISHLATALPYCHLIDLPAQQAAPFDTIDSVHPTKEGMGVIADGVIKGIQAHLEEQ